MNERELEFQEIENIMLNLRTQYLGDGYESWPESIRWIKGIPIKKIGNVGEMVVHLWAQQRGFTVVEPEKPNGPWDRIINDLKVEIKFATLGASRGFTFNQIRDQDYDFAFLLGLEPDRVSAWFVPKSHLLQQELSNQHGGEDLTKMFTEYIDKPLEWLEPYGPTLERVEHLIRESRK